MIERFYTKEFTVMRQGWLEETIDDVVVPYSAEVEVGTFKGHLQQASREYMQSLGLTMTKPFLIWCAVDTDVTDGDMVIFNNGKYTVRGKQENNTGRNTHLELLVEWYGNVVVSSS